MRKLILPCLCLALTGCAMEQVGDGLAALRGKNLQTAIGYLGYPDNQYEIAGNKVYVWENAFSQSQMVPVTSYDTGNIMSPTGGVPVTYRGTTTTYQSQTNNYSCQIKIVTNPSDVIIDSQFEGDVVGCGDYGTALDKAAKDLGPVQ